MRVGDDDAVVAKIEIAVARVVAHGSLDDVNAGTNRIEHRRRRRLADDAGGDLDASRLLRTVILSPVIAACAAVLSVPGQTRNAYAAYCCELSSGPGAVVGEAAGRPAVAAGCGPAAGGDELAADPVRAAAGDPLPTEPITAGSCRADQPCTARSRPAMAVTLSSTEPSGPTGRLPGLTSGPHVRRRTGFPPRHPYRERAWTLSPGQLQPRCPLRQRPRSPRRPAFWSRYPSRPDARVSEAGTGPHSSPPAPIRRAPSSRAP